MMNILQHFMRPQRLGLAALVVALSFAGAVYGNAPPEYPQANIVFRLDPPKDTEYTPTSPLLLQEDHTAYMTAIRTASSTIAGTVCRVTTAGIEPAHCVDAPTDTYFEHTPQAMYATIEAAHAGGAPTCGLAYSSLASGLTPSRGDTSVIVRLCSASGSGSDATAASATQYTTEPGYTVQRVIASPSFGTIIALRVIHESSPGELTTYITFLDTAAIEGDETIKVNANNSIVLTDQDPVLAPSPDATSFYLVNTSVIFLVQDSSSSKLVRADVSSTLWTVSNPCGLVSANREIGLAGFTELNTVAGTEDLTLILWGRDVQQRPKLCRVNDNGHEVWVLPQPLPLAVVRSVQLAFDRVVITGMVDDKNSAIVVLSALDGTLLWTTGRSALDLNQSTPVLLSNFAYFTVNGTLAYRKLDLPTAVLIMTSLECMLTPSISTEGVYCVDGSNSVVSYDLEHDEVLWEAVDSRIVAQPPQPFPLASTTPAETAPWVAWVHADGSIIFATAPTSTGPAPTPTQGTLPPSGTHGEGSESNSASTEGGNTDHTPTTNDDGASRSALSKFVIVGGIVAMLMGGACFVMYRRRQNARRHGLMYDRPNGFDIGGYATVD